MEKVNTIGLDVAKRYSRFTERVQPVSLYSGRGCGVTRFYRSFRLSPAAAWRWKPVQVLTTGHGRLVHWGRSPVDPSRPCETLRQASEERWLMRRRSVKMRKSNHALCCRQERAKEGVKRDLQNARSPRRAADPDLNALRGHIGEYGLIAPQGPSPIERLIAALEDPSSGIPQAALSCLLQLISILRGLQTEIMAHSPQSGDRHTRKARLSRQAADDHPRNKSRHCDGS
ncbi:hypothetical protein ACVILL_001044 [Bradyrhizobium sp. USDA 3364]